MTNLKFVRGDDKNCKNNDCPGLYETERGTFVVRGNLLSSEMLAELDLPGHESAVEVPISLLLGLAEKP